MANRITKTDYEALAAFRYALRQFLRIGEEAATDVGLTPQQHQALLAIRGYPDVGRMTIGALAERLQLRHHSVVGLVDRLSQEGLVQRRYDRNDRRHVYVALTRRGVRLLDRVTAAHRGEMKKAGPELMEQLRGLIADGSGASARRSSGTRVVRA
ncbi:MAG TPA: MarR family transcriptional regulator [Candidatus Kapabacteria bacterium]|nr:MarR family transcriptional regulator [Candidatus Kapabacteria bacterium]